MSHDHKEVAGINKSSTPLRVVLIAGVLGLGGAEKQLYYMARALQMAGAIPKVFSLTRGEFYEYKLEELNISVEHVGGSPSRLRRLYEIQKAVARFKPHIVQSGHFYANLYTVISARLCGAVGIGAIRGDAYLEQDTNGLLGIPSLHLPQTLIANSWNARYNVIQIGVKKEKIHLLENIIDLNEFDQMGELPTIQLFKDDSFLAMIVSRFSQEKRLDLFVKALSIAREKAPGLKIKGAIAGQGPEMGRIKSIANASGLDDTTLCFLGRCDNIPALLKQAHIFVLTSKHEGFPNVLLEAMAAGLPIISTPSGDSQRIVEDGRTGFIVDHDDIAGLAEKITLLASSPELRKSMGEAGRQRVEQVYASPGLAERLLKVYALICERQKNFKTGAVVADLLANLPHHKGQIYKTHGNESDRFI